MKKIVSILFSLCLIINNISIPVQAQDSEVHEVVFTISEEERKKDVDRQIQERISQISAPRMDEYIYEYVVIDNSYEKPKITSYSNYYRVGGQGNGGTTFENSIGSIHWKEAGGSTADISLSVGLSAGPVTVSVGLSIGTVTTSNQAERSIQINEDQIGHPVMLYIRKNYGVTRYAVYRYNKYSGPSTRVLSHYEDIKSVHNIAFKIEKI